MHLFKWIIRLVHQAPSFRRGDLDLNYISEKKCSAEVLTTKKTTADRENIWGIQWRGRWMKKMTTITHEITLTIEELHKDLKAYKKKKIWGTLKTTKMALLITLEARRWNSALKRNHWVLSRQEKQKLWITLALIALQRGSLHLFQPALKHKNGDKRWDDEGCDYDQATVSRIYCICPDSPYPNIMSHIQISVCM